MSKKNETKEEKGDSTSLMAIDFHAFAGDGFENVTANDVSIPFLKMLQKMSPEVDKTQPEYIKDAEQGDIINTLTKEVYKNGIKVIPCNFRKESIEWVLQEKGGGLKGIHSGDTPLWDTVTVDEKGRSILPNGNQLAATANHYVLYKDHSNEWQSAIISLSGTQLKKSKQWLGRIAQIKLVGPNGKFTPPMFSKFWILKSVGESNDKGSWMGWDITPDSFIEDKELFDLGMRFYETIKSSPRLSNSMTEVKQITSSTIDEAI